MKGGTLFQRGEEVVGSQRAWKTHRHKSRVQNLGSTKGKGKGRRATLVKSGTAADRVHSPEGEGGAVEKKKKVGYLRKTRKGAEKRAGLIPCTFC